MQHWRDVIAHQEEEEKIITTLQSLAFIMLFLGLFAVGLNWRFSSPPQTAIQVSLVPAPVTRFKPEPPPEPKPEVKQPKPATQPLVEPPKQTKADIALEKKQKEIKKREKEQEKLRKRKEAQKQQQEKKAREEAQKQQQEKKAREEAQKQQQEKKAREEAMRRAEALETLSNNYMSRIIHRIETHLITPPSAQNVDNVKVVIKVRLDSSGELVGSPEVEKGSGIPEYDKEAVRAVIKATPLPMPREPELLSEFEELRLHISPQKDSV